MRETSAYSLGFSYQRLVLPLFTVPTQNELRQSQTEPDLPPSYSETQLAEIPAPYTGIKSSYSVPELKTTKCYRDYKGRLRQVRVAQFLDPSTMKFYDEILIVPDIVPEYIQGIEPHRESNILTVPVQAHSYNLR
ncbi:hypothetical protein OGAPHI_007350 [Ogataea philodendri]|uniref:Uncharacterized protein n=1 Tax=Ogataea philodendri TaxID=1378263 RepID=A0A9P8NV74_9ASCO|nr:uncharacterized protein OGAPHI_007350 [Ogataea philodendri]KAH3660145.1 hypothetical protein OGAPHI_007350 [Ogataea philodendri]